MTDVEPVVNNFASSARAGRRNAVPDMPDHTHKTPSLFAQSLWGLTQHPHCYQLGVGITLTVIMAAWSSVLGTFQRASHPPTQLQPRLSHGEAVSLELNLGGYNVILFMEMEVSLYTVAIQVSCLLPLVLWKPRGFHLLRWASRWEGMTLFSPLNPWRTQDSLEVCIPSPFQ